MKIIHIHQTYLPYKGGSSMRISQILEGVSNFLDCENYLLVTRAFISKDIPDTDFINGVHVNRVPTWWHIPRKLMQLHQDHQFDLIHIHNPRAFWFSYPCIRGIPSVLEFHSLRELRGFKKVLCRWSCKLADHICVLSQASKKWLVSNYEVGSEKVSILPNGVSYDRFSSINRIYKLPISSGAAIGYIGSFYRWQGIFELVEAMSYVLDKMPEAFLVLIGDGPDRAELEERIDELGIRSRTVSLGAVPAEEVAGYLKRINLFTMLRPKTQATELTMPLKMFEVGLAGVPLLVSNRPGLLEVAGKKARDFFFVQESLCPQAVADRILSILSEEMSEERNQRSCRFRKYLMSNDFSWERTAKIQYDIYKKLLNKI